MSLIDIDSQVIDLIHDRLAFDKNTFDSFKREDGSVYINDIVSSIKRSLCMKFKEINKVEGIYPDKPIKLGYYKLNNSTINDTWLSLKVFNFTIVKLLNTYTPFNISDSLEWRLRGDFNNFIIFYMYTSYPDYTDDLNDFLTLTIKAYKHFENYYVKFAKKYIQ